MNQIMEKHICNGFCGISRTGKRSGDSVSTILSANGLAVLNFLDNEKYSVHS